MSLIAPACKRPADQSESNSQQARIWGPTAVATRQYAQILPHTSWQRSSADRPPQGGLWESCRRETAFGIVGSARTLQQQVVGWSGTIAVFVAREILHKSRPPVPSLRQHEQHRDFSRAINPLNMTRLGRTLDFGGLSPSPDGLDLNGSSPGRELQGKPNSPGLARAITQSRRSHWSPH